MWMWYEAAYVDEYAGECGSCMCLPSLSVACSSPSYPVSTLRSSTPPATAYSLQPLCSSMRVHSCHLPQRRVHSSMMEVAVVTVVVVAVWPSFQPVCAQTTVPHDFILRPEDLMAGSVSELVRAGSFPPSPCSNPNDEQGVCGSVTTCPAYLPLLHHVRNETVLEFFRLRVCRYKPGLVHVCCPERPKHQPSSIFFLESGRGTEASQRGSQRPNARRPSLPGFEKDAEEDEQGKPLSTTSTPTAFQPTFQSSFPARDQAIGFPQSLPVTRGPTTPVTTTPGFAIPDRVRGPVISSSNVPEDENELLTEPPEPPIIPSEDECGTLAMGRTSTTPWVVGVGVMQQTEFLVKCSGALVSSLHVVTAAHCVLNHTPSQVRIGDPQLVEHSEDVPLLTWSTAAYNSNTRENDLALLTLARPVTFTDNIRPVCLPFRYRFDGFRSQVLQVVGWGGGGLLETGDVEILGSQKCREAYQSPALIHNTNGLFNPSSFSSSSSSFADIGPRSSGTVTVDRRNLCGSPAPSTTSSDCLSNYGAPIFFHDEETTGLYFLAGMASLGDRCQEGPGLYTRLGAFIPWLSQELSRVEPLAPNPAPHLPSTSTRRLQFMGRRRRDT